MKQFISKLQKATKNDLYDISLKSSNAKSKEVFIFEKGDMSDLFGKKEAEQIRSNFLQNKAKVKQITNISELPKFTENDEFTNEVMSFRYIPESIFTIEDEVLIFDNVVAIYNQDKLLIIEDSKFANTYKQLFLSIWEQGQTPKLGFDYKPNHSFYNNLNYFIDKLQIIVWPDADAKKSYKDISEKRLEEYLTNIIKSDDYYNDSSYIIIFIWSYNGEKMADVWKFNDNHVDDRSGPLSECRVYREGKICTNLGLASGKYSSSFMIGRKT